MTVWARAGQIGCVCHREVYRDVRRRSGDDFLVTYQVGKLPYAVLVDEAGIIRSKGLVSSREHIESLFEAKERGVASVQEYFAESADNR